MSTPSRPIYPSAEAISYGLWLKRFATLLPAYADYYGLSALQLLEVQSIAAEYLDLLICLLQRANAHLGGVAAAPPALACELMSCHEYAQVVQHLMSKFVAQVQQHPGYATCDGQALRLYEIPLLSELTYL